MRLLTTLLFAIWSLFAGATTWYVTPTGTSPFTGTQAAPWPYSKAVTEFAKTSGSLIAKGDNILFKRGENYDVATGGTLAINISGTATERIYIGTYGAGAMPVLTGFRTVSAWASVSGYPKVYESATAISSWDSLNYVLVNNKLQPLGRHPNATNSYNPTTPFGFYKALYDPVPGTTSDRRKDRILSTNTALDPANGSWAGAWVWFKSRRFYADRKGVTSHIKNAAGQFEFGVETMGYGFDDSAYTFCFLNHLRTLDLNGEWMYDKATKKIRMYFDGTPSANVVKVAAARDLIQINNTDYITIEGLRLEGAWRDAIRIYGSSSSPAEHNYIYNCDIQFMGASGVMANQQRVNYSQVIGNTIADCNLGGVEFGYGGGYNKINNNTFKRVGLVRENTAYNNIQGLPLVVIKVGGVNGPGNEVRNNIIDSTGYIGIRIDGAKTIVRNNTITNTQLVMDDGASIYTYGGMASTGVISKKNGVEIVKNLIINPVSPSALIGHPKSHDTLEVHGAFIYTDDGSMGIVNDPLRIDSNIAINSRTYGLYIHNSAYVSFKYNTFYRAARPLYVHNDGITNGGSTTEDDSIYGLTSKYNKFHNHERYNVIAGYYLQYPGDGHMAGIGQVRGWDSTKPFVVSMDSNYWIKPVQASNLTEFRVITNFRGSPTATTVSANVKNFAARWGYEPASKMTYVFYPGTSTTDAANKHNANVKFFYNVGSTDSTIIADTTYYDEDGYLIYKNTPITLAPWTTKILVRYGAARPFTPPFGYAGQQVLKKGGATLKRDDKVLMKFTPLIQQNAWLWSEQLDNAATSKTGVTVTANTTTAPDNMLTGDRATVTADITSSRHLTQTVTLPIVLGNTYTFSTHVKNVDRQFVQLFLGNTAFGSQAFANFDLTANDVTYSGGSVVDAGIENAANGWKRIWVTAKATSSQSTTLGTIALANGPTMPRATSYATTTESSVDVWGVQVNPGFKQPYTLTTSTAVQ